MKGKPRTPTYESLLAAIAAAPSAADLALLLRAARSYFHGRQREDLEDAVAKRQAELPDGEAFGR